MVRQLKVIFPILVLFCGLTGNVSSDESSIKLLGEIVKGIHIRITTDKQPMGDGLSFTFKPHESSLNGGKMEPSPSPSLNLITPGEGKVYVIATLTFESPEKVSFNIDEVRLVLPNGNSLVPMHEGLAIFGASGWQKGSGTFYVNPRNVRTDRFLYLVSQKQAMESTIVFGSKKFAVKDNLQKE